MSARQVNFPVHDLAAGIRFYSAMFAREPAVLKPDCATWKLKESPVSFTIFVHHPFDTQAIGKQAEGGRLDVRGPYQLGPEVCMVSIGRYRKTIAGAPRGASAFRYKSLAPGRSC